MTLWVITYNRDPNQTYVFTCGAKAYGSVMGSISTYCDQSESTCPRLLQIIENTGKAIQRMWEAPRIPIEFLTLHIDLRRVELTSNDDLVALLIEVQSVLGSCMCKRHCKNDPGINMLRARINDILDA